MYKTINMMKSISQIFTFYICVRSTELKKVNKDQTAIIKVPILIDERFVMLQKLGKYNRKSVNICIIK